MDLLETLDDDFDDFDDLDDDDEVVTGELMNLDDEDMELSEDRAREITDAIRAAATATYLLIQFAHKHKAHKALGYSTWAEYVEEEFDLSAQRSYQLLDFAKIKGEIESVVPEGTIVKLTESQARDLKKELPYVTEKIGTETKNMSPEDASSAVDDIVKDVIDSKKEEQAALEDHENRQNEADADAESDELESRADQLLSSESPDGLTNSADDELIEVDVEGDGEADLSPADAMNIYNFFNLLTTITSMPEPDDFVNVIPANRKDEVNEQLLEAVSWLNRFQTLWELEYDDEE